MRTALHIKVIHIPIEMIERELPGASTAGATAGASERFPLYNYNATPRAPALRTARR
jgi:hypothetical protein